MKHKSKIDQRFKEGLDQKGFEYKEEYWDAMSSMLDKQSISAKTLYREIYLIAIIAVLQIAFFIIPRNTEEQFVSSEEKAEVLQANPIVSNELSQVSTEPEANGLSGINSETDQSKGDLYSQSSYSNQEKATGQGYESQAPNSEIKTNTINTVKDRSEDRDKIKQGLTIAKEGSLSEEREDVKPKVNEVPTSVGILSNKLLNTIPTGTIAANAKKVNHNPRFKPSIMLYVEPFVEYQMYNRQLGMNAPINLKQDEIALNSTGYGVNLRLNRGKWNISTGIVAQSIREKVTYREEYTSFSYDSSLKVVDWNYGSTPSGNRKVLLAWQVDSVGTTQERTVCEACETEFRYLRIPLELSYGIRMGRSELFVSGGINFNLLRRASGQYSGLNSYEDLSQSSAIPGKNWTSWTAGVSYRTELYGPVGIMATYKYQQGMSSMISLYDQRARLHNLQVGLSVKLF
ncbi:hypothetical protein GYB22_13175 [bacterium]|nr:hypothetical protein [bacterium]